MPPASSVADLHVEVDRQELAQVLVLVAGRRRHLLLHVGVRRGRRIERHGLQESFGEPLQALFQAALQSVRVEGLGQGRLHHGLAVRQRQVEVERVEIEETRGHRREAVLLRDLEGDRAVAGVRVHDLHGELAARGFRQFRKDPVEFPAERDQRLRQPIVRRDVAGERDRLRDAVEHAAPALEPVQHLLDAAREVVLRVAQLHVEVRLALHLDLDQVAEAEHLVLVPVLHQHVEVGVHQARLVPVGDLERHRADAVLAVGLVLEFRVVRRVDEFEPQPAVGRDLVLAEQVPDLRHERREQRVGPGAEVAAQQERLPQLRQVRPRRVGDGVLAALGHVEARQVDAPEPDVGHDEVERHERGDAVPRAMPRRGPVRRPAMALEGVHVQRQEHAHDRHVVVEVAEVEHAADDGLEAGPGAEAAQHVADLVREQLRHEGAADEVEHAAAEGREDQGDDLVVRARADVEAH